MTAYGELTHASLRKCDPNVQIGLLQILLHFVTRTLVSSFDPRSDQPWRDIGYQPFQLSHFVTSGGELRRVPFQAKRVETSSHQLIIRLIKRWHRFKPNPSIQAALPSKWFKHKSFVLLPRKQSGFRGDRPMDPGYQRRMRLPSPQQGKAIDHDP